MLFHYKFIIALCTKYLSVIVFKSKTKLSIFVLKSFTKPPFIEVSTDLGNLHEVHLKSKRQRSVSPNFKRNFNSKKISTPMKDRKATGASNQCTFHNQGHV